VSRFHFSAPGLFFGGTVGVGSRFHVLRSWTCFRRFRERRVSFSCFLRPDSFSAVPRASCPFFMYCAPGLIFGGTEGVPSRFHFLRSRNLFRRYRRCMVPFSSFVPGFIFGGTVGVVSCFHVLLSRTRFRRFRGRRVSFSCFSRHVSSSAVLRASCPVFIFSAPGLFFGGTVGVGSRFHVLRVRTHFRRYRGRRVLFSRFALLDSFSAVDVCILHTYSLG
jgi:hypothetical protein